jgi:hypothetical protein
LDLYTRACRAWDQNHDRLPYPKSKVPVGEKTKSGLLAYHYHYWHQMFGPRQLLCLSSLLSAAAEEKSAAIRELLFLLVSATTDTNNVFTRYMASRNSQGGQTAQGVFARHDFQPKTTICEQNVWGLEAGGIGSFIRRFWLSLEGVQYQASGWDVRYTYDAKGRRIRAEVQTEGLTLARMAQDSGDMLCNQAPSVLLAAEDSQQVGWIPASSARLVVTDPPYGGNINYAELTDFYYAWLRVALCDKYPAFAPDNTPKEAEVIENPTRGKTADDFKNGLMRVFEMSRDRLEDDGLVVFTFHHAESRTWEQLLSAICDAGFAIIAVYPVQAEAETSSHLMNAPGSISYDLIHVCRKREAGTETQDRSWAGIRQEIRRRARREIEMIETGRYGNEPLSPADVNIVLIGKCLELYSRHYGHVLDHEGRPVPLHEALEAIRMEVDQLVTRAQPLPGELADIDPVSYVYFVCLAERVMEIKSDEVNKYTRGLIEPAELLAAGLITKGRTGRGRYYKIKSPAERFEDLQGKFTGQSPALQTALPGMEETAAREGDGKTPFIDYVHFLIGLAEGGENLRPWMERFRGMTPQIRAACEYLRTRQPRFAGACGRILKFIEVSPLLDKE